MINFLGSLGLDGCFLADVHAKQLCVDLVTLLDTLFHPGLEGLGFDLLCLLSRIALLAQETQ
jgi:hypothetical protein